MGKVIWTQPALDDLKNIVSYIAEDSPTYAEDFGLQLVDASMRLGEHPRMGRVVPELHSEGIRELIRGNYRIIYQVGGDVAYIVAVIHANRDIIRHLDPGEWDLG
ncbi:MAG: type II toxin-antitoxin system RelE/ParE family toxin [Phycisphaerae bacterium]